MHTKSYDKKKKRNSSAFLFYNPRYSRNIYPFSYRLDKVFEVKPDRIIEVSFRYYYGCHKQKNEKNK